MILYGTAIPSPRWRPRPAVVSVHAKDGTWPPKDKPDALGIEQPFGAGDVGPERFIAKLKEIGYNGTLNVEREIEDQRRRLEDIRNAVVLLERLLA